MPKYRKFHTKAVESLDINDMPDDFTRLMWVMLPLALCREGRGLDRPEWLKSKVFPLRFDVTREMIADAMDWYESRGMLQRYEVDGRRYFCLVNWHKYQGTTTKEAESNYPPPPDSVQTNSRVAPDQLPTNSSTDAICNIQYSDSNAESNPEVAATPSAEPDITPSPPIPVTFAQWQEAVKETKNRPAMLRNMIEVLYPDLDPPAFGYIGTTARKVGGWGRLADLLWQNCTRPPTGDLLAYIQGVAKGKNRDNGRTERKTVPRQIVTGWEDFAVEPVPEPIDGQ